MIIKLSDEIKNKCQTFAKSVVSTNIDRYRMRNQEDISKIINDIYIGKLAEYACFILLKNKNLPVSEPDIKIYESKYKSFSADLDDGKHHYHVKCMKKSTSEKFGLSWSFQVEDSLVHSPNKNDMIVLCEYDDMIDIVDVKLIVKANSVKTIYTHPKLSKLRGIKKVLMWEDIKREFLKKKG